MRDNVVFMKDLDITLRDLFLHHKPKLLEILAGAAARQVLNVSLPRTQERMADFVALLENDQILHLEFQGNNASAMEYRMLDYYVGLTRQYHRPVRQILIYVGGEKLHMPRGLTLPRLRFRYEVVDLRRIDPEPLLASSQTADHVLAILCRSGRKPAELVRRILERLVHLEGRERQDALFRLLVLSGMRGLSGLVRKESQRMSVVIDPMENEVIREWITEGIEKGRVQGLAEGRVEGRAEGRAEGRVEGIEQGRAEGFRRLLQRQLEARFGMLPEWATQRLASAAEEQLQDWALRLLDARTLEAVLGAP